MSFTILRTESEAQPPVNVLNVPPFHMMSLDHFYVRFALKKVIIFLSQAGLKVSMGCNKEQVRNQHIKRLEGQMLLVSAHLHLLDMEKCADRPFSQHFDNVSVLFKCPIKL